MLWINEVEMTDSLEELKSWRSISGQFSQILRCWTRRLLSLNKIIQNSQFKKKVSLEEQKAQKEDRFLRGRQIAFLISDYSRATGAHDTVLDYANLFSVTLHDDNIQEFDTRWDEVLLSMPKIPSDDVLESLYQLRIREVWSTQNRIGIVRHGNSSENIDAQLSKFEDTGEEENRSETSIAQYWRPTWENWNRSSGQESKGNEWRWRRKRYLLPVERKRTSARKETNAVSGMRVTTVHKNQTTMPPHHLSHPCHEVEVCGGKDVSEAKVTVVPFSDNRADVIWRVLTRERLVNIGILPSVNFTNRNGLQSRDTCLFVPASQRLMNNQTKSQRKATIPTNEEKATTRML